MGKALYSPPMTPGQCRAARALIGWSQSDLADRSGVSVGTVRNFEREASEPVPQNELALRRALEAAGVVFLDEHMGVGVRPGRRKGRRIR